MKTYDDTQTGTIQIVKGRKCSNQIGSLSFKKTDLSKEVLQNALCWAFPEDMHWRHWWIRLKQKPWRERPIARDCNRDPNAHCAKERKNRITGILPKAVKIRNLKRRWLTFSRLPTNLRLEIATISTETVTLDHRFDPIWKGGSGLVVYRTFSNPAQPRGMFVSEQQSSLKPHDRAPVYPRTK